MPADASIYQQFLQQPKSVLDYQNQYNEADAKKNALAQSVQALQKGQMDLSNAADVNRQRSALRAAVGSGQIDLSNPDHTAAALSMAPDVAPALLKTIQESATARAKAGLDTAQAGQATAQTGKITTETQAAAVSHMSDAIAALQQLPGVTPAHVVLSIQNAGKMYGIPESLVQQAVSQVPQDQAQLPAFLQAKNAQLMSAKDRMSYITPDANTVANNQTSTANNAATNATHVQTTGMTNATAIRTTGMNNATSTANNRANIAKDYNVAGLNPDGTPGTANDSMVDAIGQYKVAPPNGMALRNPRMQQILADVTAKYPDFDATQYGARQGAAKSFSTGKDGQAVQSANTALNHLGTLRELAAAQDNGNIRLFNTIANRFATETGGAAPTNLASAVTMVGPEISKAVIGVGGGQGDREKVDAALSALTKGGKGQAAGTLATMEDLFGGRLTEAQRTYERTTGRKDFPATFLSPAAQKVLSARAKPPATAGAAAAPGSTPSGWTYVGPVK